MATLEAELCVCSMMEWQVLGINRCGAFRASMGDIIVQCSVWSVMSYGYIYMLSGTYILGPLNCTGHIPDTFRND